MSNDLRSAVKSADRIFDLFELLAPRSEGLSHTAIAEALDIPKSSLTQLMKTATSRRYIDYDPIDKRYRLGDRLATVARRTTLTQDLIHQSRSVLEEITSATLESSALNVLSTDLAEVVATVSSPQRLVSHMRLGDTAPLYATSGGKMLLAHLDDKDLEHYVDRVVFEAVTPNTISSASQLRKQLLRIRSEGVARSVEEYTPGIIGIATAVLAPDGRALASLNIAMPTVRFTRQLERSCIEALRSASSKLEARARL